MRRLLLATTLLPLLSGVALAQGYSSVDDLIKQLKPSAGGPTRGLRPHAGAATPVAEPVQEAPRAVATQIVRPAPIAHREPISSFSPSAAPAAAPAAADPQGTANLTIQFENGSERLGPGATAVLDRLGQALSSPLLANSQFHIIGHTDTVGRPDVNLTLSQRRAAAVAEYLATRFSVDRNRLIAEGKGEGDPLIPTPQGVPEPRNRRVQIVNTGG